MNTDLLVFTVPPHLPYVNASSTGDIDIRGDQVTVVLGNMVTLTCSISSPSTPLQYAWFLDSTRLTGRNSSLQIQAADTSRAGNYTCLVSNSKVESTGVHFTLPTNVSASLTLHVQGQSLMDGNRIVHFIYYCAFPRRCQLYRRKLTLGVL